MAKLRITNEQFLERLHSINKNIEPLEEYAGSGKKIKCRCRVCGHEWEISPEKIYAGRGCPVCGRKKNAIAQEQKHMSGF